MSFFEKSKILLKKTIHFTHFGVRPTNLRRRTFIVRMRTHRGGAMRPLCSRLDYRGDFAKNGAEIGEYLF
jgi:hypothetical protein